MKFHQIFELTQEELDVVMGRKIPEELGWESHPGRGTWTWSSPDGNIAYRDEESYLLVGDNYVLISETITGSNADVTMAAHIDELHSRRNSYETPATIVELFHPPYAGVKPFFTGRKESQKNGIWGGITRPEKIDGGSV